LMETKSADCGAIRACVETHENVEGKSQDVGVGVGVGVDSAAADGPVAPSLPPQAASRNGTNVQPLMTADRSRTAVEEPALHAR